MLIVVSCSYLSISLLWYHSAGIQTAIPMMRKTRRPRCLHHCLVFLSLCWATSTVSSRKSAKQRRWDSATYLFDLCAWWLMVQKVSNI